MKSTAPFVYFVHSSSLLFSFHFGLLRSFSDFHPPGFLSFKKWQNKWEGCEGVLCTCGHTHANSVCLSDPLSDKLTEDDAALLFTSLHFRRSAVQIARLRAPHSLSKQAFHILTAWRRGLPSSSPKCPVLAHCLTRAERPDLTRELLLREAADYKIERKARWHWICLYYIRNVGAVVL